MFAAIDNLADAQSFSQAYKVYADYLRQQTKVSVARVEATQALRAPRLQRVFAPCGTVSRTSTAAVADRLIRRHSKRVAGPAQAGPPRKTSGAGPLAVTMSSQSYSISDRA